MPLIGVVADDLTGATTTGVLLARSKAHTAVFFNEKAAEEAQGLDRLDAILISSNSRPLPAEEAYAKVASATRALQRMGVQYFSKRITPPCAVVSAWKSTPCSIRSVKMPSRLSYLQCLSLVVFWSAATRS